MSDETQTEMDRMIYGTSYRLRAPDGTEQRIDPRDVQPIVILGTGGIDGMESGPELDKLIATQIMGAKVRKNSKGLYDLVIPGRSRSIDWVEREGAWQDVPQYSKDIAAAWQVLDAVWHNLLIADDVTIVVGDGRCSCLFDYGAPSWQMVSYAATAPLAICRAALKVVAITKVSSD